MAEKASEHETGDGLSLVSLKEAGIKTAHYYWTKREHFGITREELCAFGVENDDVYVHPELIGPLHQASQELRQDGYELVVYDGYRSPELYEFVKQKVGTARGTEEAAKLFNIETMPHSSGKAVDVNLSDSKTGRLVEMRDKADDRLGGQFVGFYRHKQDLQSRKYQRLQDLVFNAMTAAGFRLGSKNEFWHFEYA